MAASGIVKRPIISGSWWFFGPFYLLLAMFMGPLRHPLFTHSPPPMSVSIWALCKLCVFNAVPKCLTWPKSRVCRNTPLSLLLLLPECHLAMFTLMLIFGSMYASVFMGKCWHFSIFLLFLPSQNLGTTRAAPLFTLLIIRIGIVVVWYTS